MRRFYNLSLRTKLIVSSMIISIVPLTISGYFANRATRQALINAANASLAGAAAQTAASLDGFIQANLDAVRTEAQLPDFGVFLDRNSRQPDAGSEPDKGAARTATVLLALSRREQLYILSYALLDENGIDVIDTSNSGAGVDQSRREYFRRPITTGLPYVSPVEFPETADPPSIYFSAPIRNAQGETVGVLRVRYDAAILQQTVANTRGLAGSESVAVLLDENHMRLADGSTPDLIFKTVVPLDPAKLTELQAALRIPRRPADQLSTNQAAFERGLANAAAQPLFRAELQTSETTAAAVAVAPVTAEPWLVAFVQPEAVFLAPVQRQTRNSLLIGSIMTALIALAVAAGAQLLTGPILRLTAVAEKVGAGDLGAQVRVEASDEIGRLATTFNKMTMQLRQTLEGLAERTAELRLAVDRLQAELLERQRGEAALRESEAKYRALVDEVSDGFYISDLSGALRFANRALAQMLGFERPEALMGRSFSELVPPAQAMDLAAQYQAAMTTDNGSVLIAAEVVRQDGTRAFVEIKPQVIIEAGRPVGSRGTLRDVTERKRAEEEIRRRMAELEAVNKVSTALRAAQTLDEMLPLLLDETLAVLGTDTGAIWLRDERGADELRSAVSRGWHTLMGDEPIRPGGGISGTVFATGVAHISRDYVSDPLTSEFARPLIPAGWGGACVPIRTSRQIVGVVFVSVQFPRAITADEVNLLTTLAEIAGNAVNRMSLHEQTEQHLRRLSGLRAIDLAISASRDLRVTLNVLLEQVTAQLRVDAAAILLLDPHQHALAYAAGRGFRSRAVERSRTRLGEGLAGHAALERRTVSLAEPMEHAAEFTRAGLLAGEDFRSYHGVPLIAKGQVKGVLEVFHRTVLVSDPDWLDFLGALSGQAAIAIDNAQLFDSLQHSNLQLALAYDTTLEGWTRALDQRNSEADGHTQRVTQMTVRLARAMGIGDAALAQARRGAVLHDIGKMTIPEVILLKPGPLTEEEWEIMRRHPAQAYELLLSIDFLRPALDIPYYHHEKWDGTGYPGGLKGEQIPLAARIFAVADVWDSLRSDRPYRKRWEDGAARDYIREQASRHFDSQVVEAFLSLREDA